MKILVVCQHYFPDPFKTHIICESLVQRGHDVTVLAGYPNCQYNPMQDPERKENHKKYSVINGVKVHRCFTFNHRSGLLSRLVNYFSFPLFAYFRMRHIKDDFDVVFSYQLSPVLMSQPAAGYKKKHGIKAVLYCLDLWPESLLVGGIKKGSAPYRLFHKISERIYKSFDRILVTSRSFMDYFEREFGIADTAYLPQSGEDLFSEVDLTKPQDEYTDLLFAGNIGMAQSVSTILAAALTLREREDIRFHFVGSGAEYDSSVAFCQENGLSNVFFHGRHPLEAMPDFYRKADAMLLTLQKDSFVSLTLPGKVQSYMAAGKPIIAAINGEAATVIAEADCGLVSPAEDADALAAHILAFADDKASHKKWGENSKAYFDNNFRQELYIDTILRNFEELTRKEPEKFPLPL